ncbi:MAG: 2-oxoglutarate dehydrogenase complex dihydrolipoyllysine-residue succinyltransferase [Opitutales bacterium]|nr:2-oxoglutarate dehydrogenase complex dihydrolipoyllysine-residue succinyltransferase [Opitutales bacterium]
MAHEVKIPPLGESITGGLLASWRVTSGSYVNAGDILYDLETDKITSEGTAEVSGVVELLVEEGADVAIGEVVARIEESAAAPAKTEEAPASEVKADKAEFPNPPSVERLAAETGIDPKEVSGSGKDGRVTKGDMLNAQVKPEKTSTPAKEVPATAPANTSGITRRKMTPLRKRIAQRLVSAQQTAAILTTFNEVDMSAVMQLRKQYQDAFVKKHGVKLGFMSFFVKAAVHALEAVPQIASQIEGDEIIDYSSRNIGVAVSTPKGLIVPVVRDCDQKSFADIESDILNYGKKAREGGIAIDDLQGGVFTISNGGIFGSMLSTPILNQPQSGILGMHTIQERPVARDGQVVIRPMMYLALSYDHRLVDGREAVTFLVKIKEAIEDPSRILFGI